MKWIRRALLALIILVGVLAGAAIVTAQRTEHPVGFQITQATAADGHRFAMGVWYPTLDRPWPTTLMGANLMDVASDGAIAGKGLPLVVISHGNGAGIAAHADLALALASGGSVVAAPMHAGDNFGDQSRAGSASLFSGRTQELYATVDHLLKKWQGSASIDPQRIGAFGFSAGGLTVLAAVGAQPDLRRIATQCKASAEFVCHVLAAANSPLLNIDAPPRGDAFVTDARLRAAAVAAPGLGFTLDANTLSGVRVPVQMWSGEQDDKVPFATNAKPVLDGLGERVEFHSVPNAGHSSFLAPCGLLKPPGICSDPSGFDRTTFHAEMNAKVVSFFDKHLKQP